MKPILYEETETAFRSNGMGRLTDCISCKVTEERNGQYELELVYPVTGTHYEDLKEERIVACRHDDAGDIQPFRIYRIQRPMNGKVTVNARHISYQLSKVTVLPMAAGNCAEALSAMKENAVGDNPFSFWTDKELVADFSVKQPTSFRSLLGGIQGSILDVYGPGEYEWDRYEVKFHSHRGMDSGVTIRYGKNLTDVKKVTDSSGIWTGVVPYWLGMDNEVETLITLSEKVIWAENKDDYYQRMVIPLDLSSRFQTLPSEEQLRTAANAYIRNNQDTAIPTSIDVSFVNLWQTEEYKDVAPLQKLKLCDTLTIHHPGLGIVNKAKIVSVTYDVLLERYSTMTIGEVRSTLGESIQSVANDTARMDAPSFSAMEQSIRSALDTISGIKGGHIRMITGTNGEPNGFYLMDTKSIDTARNVLRVDQSGFAVSSEGINGSYQIIGTLAGVLYATAIQAGILKVMQGNTEKLYADFSTGALRIIADSFSFADGRTVESIAEEKANAAVAALEERLTQND